jgi:holo-[acyl-carrier protein] synthase
VSAAFPLKMTSIAADAARLLAQSEGSRGLIRVGVDVSSISEFGLTMATKGGAAFVRTRFSEAEQAYCDGRPERFAARWTAKEAVAKAIGTGFRGLRPRQIEIVHQPWGEPTVSNVGTDPWPNGADGWQWSLSLAHEGDAAIAVAVAVAEVADFGDGDEAFEVPRAEIAEDEPMTLDKEGGHP